MSVKISIVVEGRTEFAFREALRTFLAARLPFGALPKLDFVSQDGRLPKGDKLARVVTNLLSGKSPADAVIALTDIYTGSDDFPTAQDAKAKMRGWVGDNPRFYPHVALHDFEAWLLPYWSIIQQLAGSNRAAPGHPENVNHAKPPADLLQEVFSTGSMGRSYVKTRDAKRILQNQDLTISANACPQLKLFLNTILAICGGAPLT